MSTSTQDTVTGPATAAPAAASVEQLAAHLTSLSNQDVAALLLARPDLAAPPSGSFTALAARAGARPSVEAALADLDAPTLAAAEAVLALGTQDVDAIAAGLGLPEDDVVRRLAHLRSLALVVEVGPVAGLVDALGPHPLGLGPVSTRERQNLPPSLTELENGVVPGDQAGSADALRAQADSAKLLRDMEALRTSLDQQEGSRFAQLQTHLDERFRVLGQGSGGADVAALSARVDALQRDLNVQLAQMDDYLKTKLG